MSELGIHSIGLFVLSGFLLNVTPGPDMALVIARSTSQGSRAGMAAALGVGAGALVHIVLGAVGLSALIMASAWAFTMLKFAGAAYLVGLGATILWSSIAGGRHVTEAPTQAAAATASLWMIFWQGALTNALNPKVAIFFLAFLPQFILPEAPSTALAFVVLGAIFDVVGTIWNVLVAVAAARLAGMAPIAAAKAWLERMIGVMFIAVGARLAFAER